jgi:hypothetical protein
VSTKQTNRVASKKHTSGNDKKFFLSKLISRDLRGKYAEKADQNSKKNFSVLAGLNNSSKVDISNLLVIHSCSKLYTAYISLPVPRSSLQAIVLLKILQLKLTHAILYPQAKASYINLSYHLSSHAGSVTFCIVLVYQHQPRLISLS